MDPTRRLARVDAGQTPLTSAPTPGLADTAAILLAAEQIGAATRCLDLTVEYTKDRVQFGRPIGSFQALKHRMADLYVAVQIRARGRRRRDRRAVADVGGAGAGRRQRGVLARSRPKRSRCTAGSRSPGSTTSSCTSSARTAARSCWVRRASTCVDSNPRCSSLRSQRLTACSV